MKSCKLIFLFLLVMLSFKANAQKYSFSGNVYDINKNPLYYAAVNLKGTHIYDLTDENGQYILEDIVPGKYTLYVTILGYQSIEKEIEITKDVINYDLYLKESSLALDEVVVTAKVSQSKEGSTTYKIGDDAIQQIQPISVSD
ncbi:MAG: carboxypeptidase-like regulatory domain-containing protein, partial [Bacteroidales bacterium]